jgi:hypothetical protein
MATPRSTNHRFRLGRDRHSIRGADLHDLSVAHDDGRLEPWGLDG